MFSQEWNSIDSSAKNNVIFGPASLKIKIPGTNVINTEGYHWQTYEYSTGGWFVEVRESNLLRHPPPPSRKKEQMWNILFPPRETFCEIHSSFCFDFFLFSPIFNPVTKENLRCIISDVQPVVGTLFFLLSSRVTLLPLLIIVTRYNYLLLIF
jgi:hypothetical protein